MNYDRLLAPLAKIVQALTRKTDYQGIYKATLLSQNLDGTVDIQPKDTSRPGLQNVPLAFGSPAETATLSNGSIVFFEFADADPTAPIVTGYVPSSSLTTSVSFFVVDTPGAPKNQPPPSIPPVPTGLLAPTFAGVARIGDLNTPTPNMTTWMSTISAALATAPPVGPIAYNSTGSNKVKVS